MNTIQHVVARQSVTRQTKTLHGIKGEVARTVQEPCDTNSYMGRRQKCHSSEAHVIDCFFFDSLLQNTVCNLYGDRERVGIASGRARGSNLVEQPFQCHGLLIRQSWCCFREQEHIDPLGRRLELSLSEFRSGGSSSNFGHTRSKASACIRF